MCAQMRGHRRPVPRLDRRRRELLPQVLRRPRRRIGRRRSPKTTTKRGGRRVGSARGRRDVRAEARLAPPRTTRVGEAVAGRVRQRRDVSDAQAIARGRDAVRTYHNDPRRATFWHQLGAGDARQELPRSRPRARPGARLRRRLRLEARLRAGVVFDFDEGRDDRFAEVGGDVAPENASDRLQPGPRPDPRALSRGVPGRELRRQLFPKILQGRLAPEDGQVRRLPRRRRSLSPQRPGSPLRRPPRRRRRLPPPQAPRPPPRPMS
mmetsp:Transcript_8003/g.24725  ORF Transcript_8003/g.24725 Transcript_8003/m.24725 type:complete len:265 (-) Transcript_8003:265-1059(-)